MTSNSLLSKLKTKIIIAFIIVGILFTSLFFLSACSDEQEEVVIPNYSYTDTDDGLISNPNFNYNTAGIELVNYPQTSPTGWSRSKDTNGNSSSAKSGVVDVSEAGWAELLKSIYSDTYYVQYLESALSFSKTDAETALKNENADISADAIKTEIVNKYISNLTAPVLKDTATDSKVYMLNNYTSRIGIGASQKITSSKAITINKGEYVKITVDVLTQNIKVSDNVTLGMTGANGDGKFGASIRLTNTLNSSSQAEYAITNIDTKGAWETYTLYAKGDAEFDSAVTLALGLGYSDLYPTQGTVYFDNVTVEHVKNLEGITVDDTKTLTYGETETVPVNAEAKKTFVYDMTLTGINYNKSITTATVDGALTAGLKDGDKFVKGWEAKASHTFAENKITATLETPSSYTLSVKNPTDAETKFEVAPESYAYVSFKLNNNLNKLGNTSVTVDVYETTDGANEKKAAIATITDTGLSSVGVMIKNNFGEDFTPAKTRTFYLSITVGPTKISDSDKQSDYATGTVEISELKIATGKTYQYVKDGNGNPTDTETDNYKFYQFFNGVADGSTSLYAGYESDFTASKDDTASTGFGIAATYKEYINKQLVAPSEYDGVSSNHIYLTNKEGATSKINTRLTSDNGNFAGVIDTKYVANFAADKKPADLPTLDKDIRPLMIYNAAPDSYGFISNTDAKVVAANSYAKVSVQVRVDGEAKAYIYLVDTATKDVMTFDTFTPNSNGLTSQTYEEKVGDKFMFEVGNTGGEWQTVNFYIATGKTEKSFRVELWNGSRDGASTSKGYVFFKSVDVSLSNGFTEPAIFNDTFTSSSSPLYAQEEAFSGENDELLCYVRTLTDTEKEFNEEYPDNAVSYSPKVIWAQNENTIYAIFNTIDVEETNPYDSIEEETDSEEESGCAAETDPATFWLSFSSILLAVVLVLAIVMLFVKNIRRRRKANAKDAKSHYTVKSRVRKAPQKSKKKAVEVEDTNADDVVEDTEEVSEETETVETVEELPEEVTEENTDEENKEQTLDDYVYGDVQDFGEENTDSQDSDNEEK